MLTVSAGFSLRESREIATASSASPMITRITTAESSISGQPFYPALNIYQALFKMGIQPVKIRSFSAICSTLFFLSCLSFAQGTRYDGIVLLDTGRPASGASVKVCSTGSTGNPCSPAATIYSDVGLTTAIVGSTVSTDSHGNFHFFAACGQYDISFSGSGLTGYIEQNVQIGACNNGAGKALLDQINGQIKMGGAAYPATQTGLQQALTDACSVGNGNGTDITLPPATSINLTAAVGGALLTSTCPVHMHGSNMGSTWLVVANGIASTVPTFLIKPSGANLGYWEFDHMRGTTAALGATGGDWFFLDTTLGDVSNFIVHDSSFQGQCKAAGSANCDPTNSNWFINMNTAGGATHVFLGHIFNNNTLEGGINCNGECSDSWRIVHNSFGSPNGNTNPCVNGTTFNNGTAMLTLDNNNGGCLGGFFISHGTLQCKILHNQIEQPPAPAAASTEANSAIIDLIGDTYAIDGCEIVGNNIGSNDKASINIRVANATNTSITGRNVIGVKATTGTGITLTASSSGTVIDANNTEFVTSGGAASLSNLTSANPFCLTFPKADGTLAASICNATDGGLKFTTNGGKTWTIVNGGTLFNCAGCALGLNGGSAGSSLFLAQPNAGGNYTQLALNSGPVVKLQVASDFTTTSASLATITGLTFTQLANATNYSFHCEIAYSQATAAVADAFGIQVATASPTNVFATGKVWTSATAFTSGVLPTLATTTATNIVTFTPSATATNFLAELNGTVELSAAANTVNFMALTGNASDALTIKRGSYCQVW